MKDSTVLITGVTGFIGSHLARRLLREGAQVHAVIRASSDLKLVDDIADRLHLHVSDDSVEAISDSLAGVRPSTVFHLASLFLAVHQPPDVGRLVDSNVRFGAALAEVITAADRIAGGLPGFVNVGTAWQHYDSAPYHPVALYAATKQAFQDVLYFYHAARGLPVVNLKFFDTYGPRDPRRKVLAVLRAAGPAQSPLPMTGGEQYIDLVHVEDVVSALLVAAERVRQSPPRFESFAVSSGRPVSIRELARIVGEVRGHTIPIEWGAMPYREREMMRPWSAGPVLPGWKPAIPLEEGLMRLEANV